jgi:peptide/nickel transport system substrate-binding protein
MTSKRFIPIVGLLLTMMMIAAACGGNDETTTGTGEGPSGANAEEGGVYRVLTDDFGFTDAFDPSGEYLGSAWGFYSNLLVRTLVTYKHIAGVEGNALVPDLATEVPEVSDDGLTYTFTLKDGIKFGPPLDRDITPEDIKYAFERIGTESVAAQYAFYYTPIEGMPEFQAGKADDISGITTEGNTITFKLSQPTGDFLYRLAMPATGPIPKEVGDCFTKAGEYGRYVISSGPYMIEGSDDLDASSCDTLEPISGFDPNKRLSFVRNPSYDPATDDPEVRENFVDGVEVSINTNVDDIFNKIQAGEAEGSINTPTPKIVKEYVTDESLKDQIVVNPGDRTWYLTMNLTQPPFDDIHLRKAVNLALDRDALLRAWGGSTAGDIATHIVPPTMTDGHPTAEEYDPYGFGDTDFQGDVDAAKEEMKQSQYDSDGDGVCDAPECSGILMINRNVTPWKEMEPIVVDSLGSIGLEVEPRELESSAAYTTIQTVSKNVPLALNAGWGKDYADPSTFMVLFDSRSVIPEGNVNYSLIGLTPEQASDKDLGITGTTTGIPSVDADIDQCNKLTGDERQQCWIDLDAKLMEEVVPWAPYLWAKNIDIISPTVTKFEFDQFSGEAAYAHVAVDASQQ